MAVSTTATALWARVTADIRSAIAAFTDRKQVVERDGNQVIVSSYDPKAQVHKRIAKLRGLPVDPGDDVLTIQLGGKEIAIGALLKPGEVDMADYIQGFDGDGESQFAAHADHRHALSGNGVGLGPSVSGSGANPVAIGLSSYAHQNSVAIGQAAIAGDQENANITCIAIGYQTVATGSIATAIGRQALANNTQTIAIGHNVQATASGAVAIGSGAIASGAGALAVGFGASATGIRGWTIGYNKANTTADRGMLVANSVLIERSNGSGATQLIMRDSGGAGRILQLGADHIIVGSTYIGGALGNGVARPNATISSGGSVNLRVGPGNVHAAIRLMTSATMFDTGIRVTTDETWGYVFMNGAGWGWFPASRILAS